MNLPMYTTEATDGLCREIAKRSKGVAFLGFSGGKDSLCAWLQLSRYFKRIIPFHCASVPGWDFRTKYLNYLEEMFQTRILRLLGEDMPIALKRLTYQTPFDANATSRAFGGLEDYDKLDILEYLRYKFNLPRAWCAFGINESDSKDRKIYCNKTGGQSGQHRTFYPCWDWPKEEILVALEESGLKVAPEYKYTKRSMGGVPSATYNAVMKKHFPGDFATLLKWYPLAEAKNYREEMLDRLWAEKQGLLAVANGKAELEDAGEGAGQISHDKTAGAGGERGRGEEDVEGAEAEEERGPAIAGAFGDSGEVIYDEEEEEEDRP